MAIIPIENAKVGMKVDKDIYSAAGAKLMRRGTVLTEAQIKTLMKYNIGRIEIDPSTDLGGSSTDLDPSYDPTENVAARQEREVLTQSLRKIPMFQQLSDRQLQLLMASFTVQKHKPRVTLFKEKDPGDTFFVILKGSIKIYLQSAKGTEKILAVCNAGDSFGELSLLDGRPRSASAQTLQKTELLVMSRVQFLNLLENNFEITHSIMKEMIQRIRDTHQQITDLTLIDTRSRVIKSLIKLAGRFGRRSDHAIDVELPLDLNELAQMVGIDLRELHLVLNDLEEQELVRMHANYYVLNLHKLRSMR